MAEEKNAGFLADLLGGTEATAFNYFEPFDVPPRPQWLLDEAEKAGVEIKPEGGPFQTGLLLDTTTTPGFAALIAATQSGKSRTLLMEAIIMSSGQIPVALRFEKGVDTGVKRPVTPQNIARFGLREDGTCGNIIGAGLYPVQKIPPAGTSQIWICAYKQIKENMWLPRLKEFIPPYFLDHSRGVHGWSENRQRFFFANGNVIAFTTYEQGYERAEGEREHVSMIILDEEPPVRDFFVSAMEHCSYLRTCFTPIRGFSYFYYELYLPIINGLNKNARIFTCSQYDTPYQRREEIDRKKEIYKPYEIKARVWGQFSDMAGKPYYTFEITQNLLKRYVPRHAMAKIAPAKAPETMRDAIKAKMIYEPATEPGEDVWEIYEPMAADGAYWLSADVAEGNANPDVAMDSSCAYIRRAPLGDTEKDPVLVAALHSKMRNVEFARSCLYAAIYHNFALVAPESRGEDGAVFLATVSGYPFIYQHTNVCDKTRRAKTTNGFDTTGGNRKLIFDLCGNWIYEHGDNPRIYHYPLLRELSECIVGKNGRPDHNDKGSTDCLVAFGISQYLWMYCRNQIRNNRNAHKHVESSGPSTFPNVGWYGSQGANETRKILGSPRGLDQRQRQRYQHPQQLIKSA